MKNLIILCSIVLIFTFKDSLPQNVELLGSLNPYPNEPYADIWGYAANGREYALIGVYGGTSIIDVTDPANPVEVAMIPGPHSFYEWRDMKVHSHYAYIVSEASGAGAGMQIVDLSGLPDTAMLVNAYTSAFTTAHNLYIDNGYAYVVGTELGGMHIVDLSDPANPVQTAYYSASNYIHDVYVWNDTAYVSSNATYDVVDVLSKSNPQLVSMSSALPGIYAHSGWLTEDKRYFVACEEFNQRDITVWDLKDRATWNLVVPQWQMNSNSPVHNVFVKGDYAHISYYEDGYVVLDISDPENPVFAGQYDTHPGGSVGDYTGAWGVYPYLPSGNILISDMVTGLYVVKFTPPVTNIEDDEKLPVEFTLNQNYPNPFNPRTSISYLIPNRGYLTLKVYDLLGKEILILVDEEKEAGSYQVEFNGESLSSGTYIYVLTFNGIITSKKMSLIK